MLVALERRAREKGNLLIQDRQIARRFDVLSRDVGKPQKIIGAARANPPTHWRMHREHVSLFELPCGALEDVSSRHLRVDVGDGQHVLELVAKPKRATRLIEACATEDSSMTEPGRGPSD